MNIQLVESLAHAIQALSSEERALLNEKLTQPSNWPSLRPKILANAQAIQQRRGGVPSIPILTPSSIKCGKSEMSN